MDLFTIAWLVFGVSLMLAELVLPGLVIVFFGAAALLVGLASWLGWVSGLGAGVGLWLASSAGLILGVRGSLKRVAAGELARGSTDEAIDAFGHRVLVVEAMGPDQEGRIRYQGTTWPARTLDERLEPGAPARIVTRDNLVWIVEADERALPASVEAR